MIWQFLKDETGVTAVEYGLIVGVLSLAIIAGFEKVTEALAFLWGDNESRLQQAFN